MAAVSYQRWINLYEWLIAGFCGFEMAWDAAYRQIPKSRNQQSLERP